ncbi:MAG TPA: class I SAM-dependent methyltransferase [Bryobacterales bacterium]|nr:class I SAM-dependent methyltransferase [Bryobacterales bacterium]
MKSPLDQIPMRLICPACRTALEAGGDGLRCGRCGRSVPIKNGVPSFCEADPFYEEYISRHVPYHLSPAGLKGAVLRVIPYWSWREWRFWRRNVPRGGWLLDLGCARGRQIFVERAAGCVGVDTALTALAECAQHYKLAIQSGLMPIPLESESFDCVVTSHVIGHIPPAEKDAVYSEIARVLKRGGRSVNVIETDSRHPLLEFAKRWPDLYQRHFIDPDGHVGLELPSAVIERFRRHGLRLVTLRKMEAGPLHPRQWLKHFDNEYREKSAKVDAAVGSSQRLMQNPVLLAIMEMALGAAHYTIGQWRYPLDHANFIAAVFEKE